MGVCHLILIRRLKVDTKVSFYSSFHTATWDGIRIRIRDCLLYGQALADFSATKRHSYTKDSRKCYEIINLLSKLIALLAGMMLPPPQDSKCTPFVLGC